MPVKNYLTNKIDHKRYRLNGVLPATRLPHKQNLCQSFCQYMVYSREQLPPKVDLRSDMTPVEDQSRIGSW